MPTASLERARAQFADAKRTLERTKSLFEKGIWSRRRTTMRR